MSGLTLTSDVRCDRRKLELTVEACLAARDAEIPKCAGCVVGARIASQFQPQHPRTKKALPISPTPKSPPPAAVSSPASAPAPVGSPIMKLPVIPDLVVTATTAPRRRFVEEPDLASEPLKLPTIPDLESPPQSPWPRATTWRLDDAEDCARTAGGRVESTAATPAMLKLLDELRKRGLLNMAMGIARQHAVTIEDMFERRKGSAGRARAEFCLALRHGHQKSWAEIGGLLQRDHSTILSMVRSLPAGSWEQLEPKIRHLLGDPTP